MATYTNTTISAGKSLSLRAQDIADQTVIENGGEMLVSSAGFASRTTIENGGLMALMFGGEAAQTEILSGGVLNGDNGDKGATDTVVHSGGRVYGYLYVGAGSTTISFAAQNEIRGAFSSAIITSGNTGNVGIDGYVADTTVQAGGMLNLRTGGVTDRVTVNSSGRFYISSGGVASNTTVERGGLMALTYGAQAVGTVVLSGGVFNGDNGDKGATNTVVHSGGRVYGYLYVGAGSTTISFAAQNEIRGAFSSAIIESGNQGNVGSGGRVTDTVVKFGGMLNLRTGGVTDRVTVNSSGRFYISSGGVASNTTVERGGLMALTHSAQAVNTVVLSGGVLNGDNVDKGATNTVVHSGGEVFGFKYAGAGSTTISFAAQNEIRGAFSSAIIESGNQGNVGSGGRVTDTVVKLGGLLNLRTGGVTDRVTVNSDGRFYISSGGVASNTTLERGAEMVLNYLGEATGTVVQSGGVMRIQNNATHFGEMTLQTGAVVSAAQNATIDFTLTGRSATSGYLINNLSLITGNPEYSVTVSATQEAGEYKLAQGAAGFTGSVTVDNAAGKTLGTVNVGEALVVGGTRYALNLTGSNLTFTVAGNAGAAVISEVTLPGTQVQHLADGSIWTIGTAARTQVGTLDAAAWTLLDAAGDFDRDGKAGLLWRENATGNVYMQNDLTNLAEVSGRKNLLGIVEDGYAIGAAGDFFGTGFDGALLLGPAFGDSSVSLNYGLATWTREQDGATTPGWLGALVNTWEETGGLNTLKGNYQNLTGDARNEVINANNYQYEFVGVGDFNGDGKDDVMLRNTMPGTVDGETITGAGDVFVFLTDTRENVIAGNRPADGIVYAGCATDGWDVVGIGDFNGDGVDDVLVSNGTDLAGWQLADGQRTADLWFGSLSDGWELKGVGDFNADGTDDILLSDSAGNLAAWEVKNGKVTGAMALA